MKVIDAYKQYKKKYRDYVVLIRSGIFYEVYNDDISIMYSLFRYKVRSVGNNLNIGFPISNISNVSRLLTDKKVNHLVIEKVNEEYEIVSKEKFTKNNYSKYSYIDLSKLNYIKFRINNINNRLLEKIMDEDIEDVLRKIEGII